MARGRSRTRGHERLYALDGRLVPILLAVLLSASCSRRQTATENAPQLTLPAVDSVLSELGGSLTASLSRQQRWRMISSVGTGLPPQSYAVADLPDSKSYGAAMLQVYCEQCHWLPSPQMHSAAEWPLLVRRMVLRTQMLENRLGGPAVSSLVGGMMVDVIKQVGVPSPEQVDTLLAYLRQNALPVAKPGEIGASPSAQLFVHKCTVCHETPSPGAHTATEWKDVVARMQSNMTQMGITPLTPDEIQQITAFLQGSAAASRRPQ